jgi:hypothetical protein
LVESHSIFAHGVEGETAFCELWVMRGGKDFARIGEELRAIAKRDFSLGKNGTEQLPYSAAIIAKHGLS